MEEFTLSPSSTLGPSMEDTLSPSSMVSTCKKCQQMESDFEKLSVSPEGRIQYWSGYWQQLLEGEMGKGQMEVVLYVADYGELFGGGKDVIGDSTWKGCRKGSRVNLVKNYINEHEVYYDGEIINESKIQGRWTIPHNDSGDFCLERREDEAAVSQEWIGFYVQQEIQHDMTCKFVFSSKCGLYGLGSDEIGHYIWLGTFEVETKSIKVKMTKQYNGKHAIQYFGDITTCKDGKKIMEGKWKISSNVQGTFQLREKN